MDTFALHILFKLIIFFTNMWKCFSKLFDFCFMPHKSFNLQYSVLRSTEACAFWVSWSEFITFYYFDFRFPWYAREFYLRCWQIKIRQIFFYLLFYSDLILFLFPNALYEQPKRTNVAVLLHIQAHICIYVCVKMYINSVVYIHTYIHI